jgi:hypothetical protein
MRRAVILATLTCILFAVAGVTVAGENTFTSGSPDGEQTESTGLGRTVSEATALEATVPDDVEKPVEGTVEATVGVHEEQKEPGKGETGAGNYGGIQDDNRIEDAGEPTGKPNKPEHAQGGKKYGKPRVAGKPPAKSKPTPDDAGKKGFDGNPGKVTICHKERVTISVGAPAWPAHQRHGDSLGTC